MTYPFVDKSLYSTLLGQLPEEFGRFEGNFHNCYGSYMNLFSIIVI